MNKKINKKKNEKEPTIEIVNNPDVDFDAEPVQSPHFEPSISSYDAVSGASFPYYPSGQKILRDAGKTVTYDNYKSFFKTDIDEKEIKIIDAIKTSADAKKKFNEDNKKYNKYVLICTIFLKLLEASIVTGIISLPIIIFIAPGITPIDNNNIYIFYVVLFILFIVSCYCFTIYGSERNKKRLASETSYRRWIEFKSKKK